VTAEVRNAMMTAAARSPAWTRGGKRRGACDARVAMSGGERGGGEKRVRCGGRLILKRRRGRQGRGRGPG
jgi:hypothetical protein